ncbi:MAG: hypothetical protein K6C12_03990 [Oscillospiraceae bacterium]|nr:hypothetical protein [Oscillospiraceae bacterium]
MKRHAYLYFAFPYYHRCRYFHAEAPIPLLCFQNDPLLRILEIVNRTLDSFLERELPKWFVKDFVDLQKKKIANEAQAFVLDSEIH